MNFNEKLKALRKERHITQEELGESLHVSRQAISKWESGDSMPEIEKIVELARIYQVSLDDLLLNKTDVQRLSEENSPQDAVKTNQWDKKYVTGIILFLSGFMGVLSFVILYTVKYIMAESKGERLPEFFMFLEEKSISMLFFVCCILSLLGLFIIINVAAVLKAYLRQSLVLKAGVLLFVVGLVALWFSYGLVFKQTAAISPPAVNVSKPYTPFLLVSFSYMIALTGLILLIIGIIKKIRHT